MTETQATAPLGWAIEEIPRHGSIIVVIYFDGEVRGQVETRGDEEIAAWKKAMVQLNSTQSSV